MYQHIPGFPDPKKVDPKRAQSIRAELDAIVAFQTRSARPGWSPTGEEESAGARAARRESTEPPISPAVALEAVSLLRDCVGWKETIEYTDALPQAIRELDVVRGAAFPGAVEVRRPRSRDRGARGADRRRCDSSERRGLIGGRYKKLADAAKTAAATTCGTRLPRPRDRALRPGHAARSERLLPVVQPAVPLPRARRRRGRQRATIAAQVARLACERDAQNEWSKPTFLTLAFFDQDVARARRLRERGTTGRSRRPGSSSTTIDTARAHRRPER